MYIKVKKWSDWTYEYRIYSANNIVVCKSANVWKIKNKAAAVRAAKKLATDLGIEYRETK